MMTKIAFLALFCLSFASHAQNVFAVVDFSIPNNTIDYSVATSNVLPAGHPQAGIDCKIYFTAVNYDRPIKKGARFAVQPVKFEEINLKTCTVPVLRDEIYRAFGRELPASLQTREEIEKFVDERWGHTIILNSPVHRLIANFVSAASGDSSRLECERKTRFSVQDALQAMSFTGNFSLPRDF